MVKSYLKTLQALTSLRTSLNCRVCNALSKNLYTLGGCEHRFCRSCCDRIGGTHCPLCHMPVHVRDVQMDRQLSNLVSLCMELTQIVKTDAEHGDSLSRTQSESTDTSDVAEEKTQDFTPEVYARPDISSNSNTVIASPICSEEKESFVYDFLSSPDTPGKSRTGKGMTKTKKTQLITRQRCAKKHQAGTQESASLLTNPEQPGSVGKHTAGSLRKKPNSKRRQSLPSQLPSKEKKRSPVFNGSPVCRKKKTLTHFHGANSPCNTKRNSKGETPLHVAAIKGQLELVKELLKDGASPNVRDNAGWTPLHESCNHGYTRIAELLLDYGAMIDMPGMNNDTPLHDAVMNNRIECVVMLVSRGAALSSRNIHGLTAVDYAKTDEMKEALNTPVLKQDSVPQQGVILQNEEEENQNLFFTATSMNREQKIHLQKCAAKLNAKVVEDLRPEVSHVITTCNKDGMCPRTLKYLHAILAGKWIVNTEWLDFSMEYGRPVLEEPFEVCGSSSHPGSNAPYKGRVNKKQQLPGLFDGCQFYFHGPFVYPTPDKNELIQLVKSGGGQVLTREPKIQNIDDYNFTVPYHATSDGPLANCGLFIVFDNNAEFPVLSSNRLCAVSASWIINSIATFSLLNPDCKN